MVDFIRDRGNHSGNSNKDLIAISDYAGQTEMWVSSCNCEENWMTIYGDRRSAYNRLPCSYPDIS